MENWFDEPIIIPKEEEYVRPKTSLFNFLNDITYEKTGLLTEDNKKDYSPYMVNRFLSMDIGTLMYSQEMNFRYSLEPDMHFEYLINAIRKMKRYLKYVKDVKDDDVELLSNYYQVSKGLAKQYLKLHDEADIDYIKARIAVGGVDAKKKGRKS